MLKEWPIVVTWNCERNLFHLKYIVNSKFKNVGILCFSLVNDEEELKISNDTLQKIKKNKQFIMIEKEANKLKLIIANTKDDKGIIEFDCLSTVKYLTIEMIVK